MVTLYKALRITARDVVNIVSAQHGFSNMFQIANDTVFIIITVVQV